MSPHDPMTTLLYGSDDLFERFLLLRDEYADAGPCSPTASVSNKAQPITNDHEVIGTCRLEMNVEVRVGSPELRAMLDEVTVDGLPSTSGYTRISGTTLKELIYARQRQCCDELWRTLNGMDDAALVLKYDGPTGMTSRLAEKVLVSRITAGSHSAFAALLTARDNAAEAQVKYVLKHLIDQLVSYAAESIPRKGIKELQRLAGGGTGDPVIAYAAKERLALRSNRDADLKVIPSIPIADLVAGISSGRYTYDSALKKAAYKRLRADTLGSGDIADLLPIHWWSIDGFLRKYGLKSVGHIHAWPSRANRTRWHAAEVNKVIESTTARLYHRARNEFYGRLPDALHNRMVLDGADEYVRAYIAFLDQKDRANAHESPEVQ